MQLESKRKKPSSLFNDVSISARSTKDTKRTDHSEQRIDLTTSKGQSKMTNDLSTIFTLMDQQKRSTKFDIDSHNEEDDDMVDLSEYPKTTNKEIETRTLKQNDELVEQVKKSGY